jgi:putative ABC transport system ATP-binding protein
MIWVPQVSRRSTPGSGKSMVPQVRVTLLDANLCPDQETQVSPPWRPNLGHRISGMTMSTTTSTGTTTAVSVQNVRKFYQRDTQQIKVLDGINLDVPQGEFVALMGPSGSGKTTLLNLIAGIDRVTSGRITVAGTDLTPLSEGELAKWRSSHIGFIFQFYNLIPVLSALENVELPLLLTSLSKSERHQRAMTALRIVGLEDRAKHYPRQLSGGQEQRVAIARAVVTDPTVVVADEPTGDLDHQSAEEILTLMETFNKEFGKTIIMVTHDPRAAARARIQHHLDKGVLSN